jgi:hypothetical protein
MGCLTPRLSCETRLSDDNRSHASPTRSFAFRQLQALVEPKPLRGGGSGAGVISYRGGVRRRSFLQVAFGDKEEDMKQADSEKLLADTLAAHGHSPRTQETYTLMLRLFGRYLEQAHIDKALDARAVVPEDVEAYQRYLVTERKVGFSSFNQATAPCASSTAAASAGPTSRSPAWRTSASAAPSRRSSRPKRSPPSSTPVTTSSTGRC